MSDVADLVGNWGGFEALIAKLNETGEVVVEHNVVLPGRSEAPRQIDVLIRHKQGLYEHLVVAECKYLNHSVERIHVDALATTVREVGASKGVIFTTKGFQSGAITQATHENIDLFKVRNLTDKEWGLPGRNFDMFLHVNSISIGNMRLHNTFSHLGSEPDSPNIDIHLGNPNTKSRTKIICEGKPDKTLEELIDRVARESAQKVFESKPIKFENGFEGEVRCKININIQPLKPIQTLINNGVIFIPQITFELGLLINQTRIQHDRAEKYAFALAIENCIKQTVTAASRKPNDTSTTLHPLEKKTEIDKADIYQNGSLMTLWVEGYEPFEKFGEIEPGHFLFKPNIANT